MDQHAHAWLPRLSSARPATRRSWRSCALLCRSRVVLYGRLSLTMRFLLHRATYIISVQQFPQPCQSLMYLGHGVASCGTHESAPDLGTLCLYTVFTHLMPGPPNCMTRAAVLALKCIERRFANHSFRAGPKGS